MALFLEAWRYLTEGRFSFTLILLSIPLWLACGWFVGASSWAQNERLYERAQRGEGAEIDPDKG
jgi:hypothetical protein